ncbi:hypothetical protein ACFQ3N_05565 [Virgibacillus byunsanensis]|uniref:Uncharacterized protein n=1 Tax=Virgibacillus byunsanensis TaxID=570945 RepID=A0ABW3LKB7_9BACI
MQDASNQFMIILGLFRKFVTIDINCYIIDINCDVTLGLFLRTRAIVAVWDRYGRMLSAGTASASEAENHRFGVFRHVLFPQESPPSAHPDW